MLSATNFWMGFAGLIYLVAGVFILRKEISAARGWDKLIALGCVFIAVSLAVFAPEHFHGGPTYIQNMAPSWMPIHWFWPYFVGCALLAAATSLTVRKFVRLSSTLLGLMFFLFVCMIYMPNALAHSKDRFAWVFVLRDLSFAAGAWALAGLHSRASSPQQSKWMILFGRIVVAVAAIFYGVEHFLHPQFAPGVPLELISPSWVPFPSVWAYLAGAVLLAAGIGLALNKKSRIAAASIGALMTALTLFLYLPILILAHGGSTPEINEALNYVADTLLYAGAALVLASALPRDPHRVQKT
ncbi:MAG: DoxX family membrane protein [Candidatus Sulfotelmatobacter sp.]